MWPVSAAVRAYAAYGRSWKRQRSIPPNRYRAKPAGGSAGRLKRGPGMGQLEDVHAAGIRHLGFSEDATRGDFGYSPERLDDRESLA
jgi:hypothetical protein